MKLGQNNSQYVNMTHDIKKDTRPFYFDISSINTWNKILHVTYISPSYLENLTFMYLDSCFWLGKHASESSTYKLSED